MSETPASKQASQPTPAVRAAILRLAFRPFSLLGSLFSVISLLLWAAIWAGTIEPAVSGGALWWHMHWSAWTGETRLQSEAGTVMVLLVTLLMSTMAGTVVPMFTANGTGTPRVADMPRLVGGPG